MPRTVQRVTVEGRELELSNLDKVFYPETGFTKAQVIDYYARVADAMVPHLRGRPLNLKRYPNGVDAPFFFQKTCPSNRPGWLATLDLWSDGRDDHIRFCTASDKPSLVWLANAGNLEFHTLLMRQGSREQPTMMVFDLDPGEGTGLLESAAVSLLVRDELADAGLKAVPKVSGGKGVQPYVPLNTPATFDQTRDWSLALALRLERRFPGAIVTNMRKELRKGKVLIDYSQNSRHKSTVCVYSLRARAQPSVSAPLRWREVERAVANRDADALRFGPEEVLERVRRHGDLFADVLRLKQHLPELPRAEGAAAPERRRSARTRKATGPSRARASRSPRRPKAAAKAGARATPSTEAR